MSLSVSPHAPEKEGTGIQVSYRLARKHSLQGLRLDSNPGPPVLPHSWTCPTAWGWHLGNIKAAGCFDFIRRDRQREGSGTGAGPLSAGPALGPRTEGSTCRRPAGEAHWHSSLGPHSSPTSLGRCPSLNPNAIRKSQAGRGAAWGSGWGCTFRVPQPPLRGLQSRG